MSGVATTASKSSQPSPTFFASSSPPTKSAPASSASLHLLAGGEHQHAHRLAGAVRQHHGAAHHLVGVLGIDAEAHRDVDRLVELGEADSLTVLTAASSGRSPAADLLALVAIVLAALYASSHSSISMPIDRAVPSMILIAASRPPAFRSGILGLGDLRAPAPRSLGPPCSCWARPSPSRSRPPS